MSASLKPTEEIRVSTTSDVQTTSPSNPVLDEQIQRANSTGRTPVVFVHGLWLLPSSWNRWADLFEQAGYPAVQPGWPDDPQTVEEANADPEVFAHKSVGQVADHFAEVIGKLAKKPALIGHSFGGLLAQILAGRGLAAASVAIDPAPFRGVLPLPISALKSARPVLGNPANRNRAVPLTYEQFRFGFANAVSEDEAKELYETFAVPASGTPLFQVATENVNPWTEVKVDTKNPDRGPLLVISGEKDTTAPVAMAEGIYKKQKRNEGVTEIVEMPNRGHALVIDSGWREVADTALRFISRFVSSPTDWIKPGRAAAKTFRSLTWAAARESRDQARGEHGPSASSNVNAAARPTQFLSITTQRETR